MSRTTINYTWDFTSPDIELEPPRLDGWTTRQNPNFESSISAASDPDVTIQFGGLNGTALDGRMFWQGTWEDLGVPEGKVVKRAWMSSFASMQTRLDVGITGTTVGGMLIKDVDDPDGSGSTTGGSRSPSGIEESFTTTPGSDPGGDNLDDPSDALKDLGLIMTGTFPGTTEPFWEMRIDSIEVSISYEEPEELPEYVGSAALSKHPAFDADGECPATFASETATKHQDFSASGVFITSHVGTAALSFTGPDFDAAGVITPTYAGTSALVVDTSFSSTGIRTFPSFAGTAALFSLHVLTTSVDGGQPVYSGSAALSVAQPTITASGNTPDAVGTVGLFIGGSEYPEWLANLMLYTAGKDADERSLNLSVAVDNAPTLEAPLPLSLVGGDDMAFGGIDLFSVGNEPGQNASLNLAISGVDSGTPSADMNLAIAGGNPVVSGGFTLFMRAEPPTYGVMPLALRGPEGSNGFHAAEGSMDLFVERGPEAGFTMVIANKEVEAQVEMSITGMPWQHAQADLYVCGEGGSLDADAPLSIPGVHAPVLVGEAADLWMPDVVGFADESTTLFMSGWKPR
jgi:hypothetical protein